MIRAAVLPWNASQLYVPRWALSETISLFSQPFRPESANSIDVSSQKLFTLLHRVLFFLTVPFFSFLSPSSNRPGKCMTTPLPKEKRERNLSGLAVESFAIILLRNLSFYQWGMCFWCWWFHWGEGGSRTPCHPLPQCGLHCCPPINHVMVFKTHSCPIWCQHPRPPDEMKPLASACSHVHETAISPPILSNSQSFSKHLF